MKRGVFLGLAFFLLAALFLPVASADTTLNDAWYFSGDTYIVDGELLSPIHINFYDEKIILGVDEASYVINLGECKSTERRRYCFEEMYTDINGSDKDSHIKFVGGKFVYAGLRIIVLKRGDVVAVTRSVSGTVEKDKEIEVSVKIENPTDFSTDSFRYEDVFPEGVRITSGGSYLEKSLHGVVFEQNIPPQTTKNLLYRFIIDDYIKFSNHATSDYSLNGKKFQTNTSVFSADLSSAIPYILTASLSPNSLELGSADSSKLSISLKNKNSDESLTVEELRVEVPKRDVTFLYEPGTFEKDANIYSWSGTLAPEETQLLDANARAVKAGSYDLVLTLRIKETDVKYYEQTKNLTFKSGYKEPDLKLSIKDAVVTEGGLYRIAFSVTNNNAYTGYKGVYASVKSNITTEATGTAGEILPGQSKTLIVEENLVAPSVDVETDFMIYASGHYYTNFDEHGEFSTSGKLTVKPSNKTISVSQSFDKPAELRIGDNLTVTVRVSHMTDEIVVVDVADSYSNGLKIKGGLAKTELQYDDQGEKQAYIYTLSIPDDYNSTELFVKTEARVRGRAGVVTKMQVFPVNLTKLSAEGEEEGSSSDAGSQQADQSSSDAGEEEKEPGLFTKIVNGVTDFFRRLFGMDDN
ncbi:hypothetical protein JW711_05000 [Candidatus Woesearchaeota archaeon]|nr:hypothetical protein [Candidatus Woesearchaeota archaeon]